MYVGKTNQLFVTNRLEQHKTDNVGKWASNNEHYIEFIELPREEDMNYIESYLIRKHKPELNIILATQTAPPFEIIIEPNQWINLDKYLKEIKEAKRKHIDIFTNNFEQAQESNEIFSQNIKKIIENISVKDRNFIKVICFSNDLTKDSINIAISDIYKYYNINTLKEVETICNRFISYSKNSRIEGTLYDIKQIGFFDKFVLKEQNVILYFNPYVKKFLERM